MLKAANRTIAHHTMLKWIPSAPLSNLSGVLTVLQLQEGGAREVELGEGPLCHLVLMSTDSHTPPVSPSFTPSEGKRGFVEKELNLTLFSVDLKIRGHSLLL